LENPGVDGSIILSWICRKCDVGMNEIDVAQDRERWRVHIKAAKDLRVS
jgi:C4-type Zn-finger protein